jgi:hypothetical protein
VEIQSKLTLKGGNDGRRMVVKRLFGIGPKEEEVLASPYSRWNRSLA